ncbi:hypothetical protein WA026_007258 [Henosepilachna vigintioctopunctata]|uniref:Uncharacterized protein n=1 Tax=Henosepilachna vigintioctopunctata TaxID=420089 RepID=A0AAW1ULQ2_9CUCU
MGCSLTLGLFAFAMVNLLVNVTCFSYKRNTENHARNSRAQGDEPPITDWEIGLREAVHQALLRDGHNDHLLHEFLEKAPFYGKHDAQAFGDIAILARGQLYATPTGLNFVQDPYYNDCDECHNKRRKCKNEQCEQHVLNGLKQLVALWTVKRIRHRDDNYGHRYEIEYTISPVDKALSNGFITRNGRFDYGIPGHVFVIRSNPRYTSGYQHNRFYSSPDQVKWHRNFIPRPPTGQYQTILITHLDKFPVPNIFHNSGSAIQYEVTSSTTDPKEIELYRKLIESLSAKTSTTTTGVKIEAQGTSPQSSINKATTPITPIKTNYQVTSTTSPHRTTLIQLPTGQIVPLTQISTSTVPEEHFQILTPVQIGSLSTRPLATTERFTTIEDRNYPHTDTNLPHQIPSTEVPIFIMKELLPPSAPSVKPVKQDVVKDMGTTKLPKKTTIHFFAAEDVEKSTRDNYTKDENLSSATKYPDRKKVMKPTRQKVTKLDYNDEDDFDIFPEVKPTEAMKKVTKGFNNEITRIENIVSTSQKHSTILPSTTNSTQTSFKTQRRKTTIPGTTEYLSSIYGTQTEKISSIVPTTASSPTTYNNQELKISSFTPSSLTEQQISTIFKIPTVFKTISTTQIPYTTSAPTTARNTYINYVFTTPEPRETIVTVTPAQTISIGQSTYDGSTISSVSYTGNTDITKQQEGSLLHNTFPRTTFVYPSTGISTTFPPVTVSTNLEENNSKLSTTQVYTTNIESVPTEEGKYSTAPLSTAEIERKNTQPYSSTPINIVSTHSTANIGTTKYLKFTEPTNKQTTKLKPTKFNENDFLVEDEDVNEDVSKDKSKTQEYTDDDIFGPKIKSKEKKLGAYKQLKSASYRTYFTTEPTRTVAKSPKIIYSDFYEASTIPPTTSLTQFYSKSNNFLTTKSSNVEFTTEHAPLTSQSYLTSISYEVNKKNSFTPLENAILPTIKAKLSNVIDNESVQIFKAELINSAENITQKEVDKQAFHNIALQLINHARSLDLVNQKSQEASAPQGKRTAKYKRRNSYIPKSKRIQKNVKKTGEK